MDREVERGTRAPSSALTRLLTEAAITQNGYASAAIDLVRFLGAAPRVSPMLRDTIEGSGLAGGYERLAG